MKNQVGVLGRARGLVAVGALAVVGAGLLAAPPAQALYGQTDALPGEFPYYASIGECGGAVVDEEWMITAEHCVHADDVLGFPIKIGGLARYGPAPISTPALEVKRHPDNDLALVRFAPHPGLATVELSEDAAVGDIYTSVASGYGSNDKLGHAQFKIDAQDAAGFTSSGLTGTEANCSGDSGSPAVKRSPQGDRLIGVTFAVTGCTPGVHHTFVATMSSTGTQAWLKSVLPDRNAVPKGEFLLENRLTGTVLDIDLLGQGVAEARDQSAAQRWTFVKDGENVNLVNKASNMLLGIVAGSTAEGARAVQFLDVNVNDQRWTLTPTGDGSYKLLNKNSSKFLQANGTSVVQAAANNLLSQHWNLVRADFASAHSGGKFVLKNKNSGKVLEVSSSGAVVQKTVTNSPAQTWRFGQDGGYVNVVSHPTNQLLGIYQGNAVQFPNNGAQDQEWEFYRYSEGKYMVKNKYSGKFLSISGSSTADGAAAIEYWKTATNEQNWQLVRIG